MGFGLYWQPAIVFFTLANKVHSFIHSFFLFSRLISAVAHDVALVRI